MAVALLTITVFWLVWAPIANRAARIAPRADPLSGLGLLILRAGVRLVHRTRVRGREHIPRSTSPGPLIIIANHASGADPLLIQSACPFEIVWIMASDMAHPVLAPLWSLTGVIRINRQSGTALALRQALIALQCGKVVGVFPEGRITRERCRLLPFHPGIALLARRSGAPVIPVLIERAPRSWSAWTDILTPSRSVIRALPARPLAGASDQAASDRLRAEIAGEAGWSMVEEAQ